MGKRYMCVGFPNGFEAVRHLFLLFFFCFLSTLLYAQSTHCLGLKNPTSFTATGGVDSSSWTGYTGAKEEAASTCSSIPLFSSRTTQTVAAAQLESKYSNTTRCDSRSRNSRDIRGSLDYKRRFVIKGAGYDTMTAMHLSYLPPDSSFTSSIRLGNYCGGHEAEALTYKFKVNPDNALVSIWYAMSLQDAGHDTYAENPEFVIHIEKLVEYNQWTRIGDDTLCYVQPTPRESDPIGVFQRGVPTIGNSGNANNAQAGNLYKDWQKVTIDLSRYLYSTIRIKIASSDCTHTSHYGCCYIAGECQPMKMQVDGCAHTSVGLSVLQAPAGLPTYQWYRSKTGVLSSVTQHMDSSYILLPGDTTSSLNVNIGHFVNYYTGDTMTQTQFKCVMQSLMNINNPSATVVSTMFAEISDDGSMNTYQTVCDSMRWIDTLLVSTGVYRKTFSSVRGCDSVVNLHLTVNRSISDDTAIDACESYSWHGNAYTTSGIYAYSDTTAFGCDYTDTLRLAVHHANTGSINDTVCNSVVWYDSTYTQSGAYDHHLTNVRGCDSLLTLHLTVEYGATGDSTVTACDQYKWNSVIYTSSGDFQQSFAAANGCDSVATLHLTLNNSYEHLFQHSYCDTFTWENVTYHNNEYDTAEYHYTAVNGCDSAVTYHLTRLLSTTATDMQVACDTFEWHGTRFTESNDTTVFHTQNAVGCDSAVTLLLTINYHSESADTLANCDSLMWWRDSVTYRRSTNNAYVNYTNAVGCDSTVYLWLTIYTGGSSVSNSTACDSMRWIDRRYYSVDTTVSTTLTSVHGCDSLVTLNLTIRHSTRATLYDTAIGSYTWRDNNTYWRDTVVYYTIPNSVGCDSVLTMHITIKPTPIEIVNLDDHVIVVNHYPREGGGERFDYMDFRWYKDSLYLSGCRGKDYITSIPRLQGSFYVEVPTDSSRLHWRRSNVVTILRQLSEAALSAWPSPLPSGAQLSIATAEDVVSCRLYDNQGRLCATIPIRQGRAAVPLQMASGVYMLTDGRGNQVRIVVY